MNAEQHDDRFAALLAACDEAVVRGNQARIDELLAENPELAERLERGRHCLELLNQELSSDTKRQSLALTRTRDDTLVSPDTGARRELPSRFGHFEIERELGRGGSGIVFLARDTRLGRAVALKVPHAEFLITDELHDRWKREANLAAGLDHPHLVSVYEAGDIGPVCYIASAYCRGVTLAEWLWQDSDASPEALARLLVTLADAVEHAHRRGVLHRDLKPSNVLLMWDRSEETDDSHIMNLDDVTAKITDFGLARLLERDGCQTRTGMILGTPSYMAPEQARGAKHITTAVDVYGLGAILYELLTGRPPFLAESELETLKQICANEPVVSPRRLQPKLPRALETICLKCLEKVPSRRYASAADLAADLRRFLEGYPIQARRAGVLQRTALWYRRRPLVAALAATVALCALAALSVFSWSSWRAELLREELFGKTILVGQLQKGVSAERQSRAWDAARGLVREFVRQRDERGSDIVRMSKIEEAVDIYEDLLVVSDDPSLRRAASISFQYLAEAQFRIGFWNESRQSALAAESLVDPTDSPGRAALVSLLILIADNARWLGHTQEAEAQYAQAAELAAIHENPLQRSVALVGLATVLQRAQRYDEAKQALGVALDPFVHPKESPAQLPQVEKPAKRPQPPGDATQAAASPRPEPLVRPVKTAANLSTSAALAPEEAFGEAATAEPKLSYIDSVRADHQRRRRDLGFYYIVSKGGFSQMMCQYADVHLSLASVHLACGEHQDADEQLSNARRIMSAFKRNTPWRARLLLARQRRLRAELDWASDRHGKAKDGFNQSISQCKALVNDYPDRVESKDEGLHAQLGLARLYKATERPNDARIAYRTCGEIVADLERQIPDHSNRYGVIVEEIEKSQDEVTD